MKNEFTPNAAKGVIRRGKIPNPNVGRSVNPGVRGVFVNPAREEKEPMAEARLPNVSKATTKELMVKAAVKRAKTDVAQGKIKGKSPISIAGRAKEIYNAWLEQRQASTLPVHNVTKRWRKITNLKPFFAVMKGEEPDLRSAYKPRKRRKAPPKEVPAAPPKKRKKPAPKKKERRITPAQREKMLRAQFSKAYKTKKAMEERLEKSGLSRSGKKVLKEMIEGKPAKRKKAAPAKRAANPARKSARKTAPRKAARRSARKENKFEPGYEPKPAVIKKAIRTKLEKKSPKELEALLAKTKSKHTKAVIKSLLKKPVKRKKPAVVRVPKAKLGITISEKTGKIGQKKIQEAIDAGLIDLRVLRKVCGIPSPGTVAAWEKKPKKPRKPRKLKEPKKVAPPRAPIPEAKKRARKGVATKKARKETAEQIIKSKVSYGRRVNRLAAFYLRDYQKSANPAKDLYELAVKEEKDDVIQDAARKAAAVFKDVYKKYPDEKDRKKQLSARAKALEKRRTNRRKNPEANVLAMMNADLMMEKGIGPLVGQVLMGGAGYGMVGLIGYACDVTKLSDKLGDTLFTGPDRKQKAGALLSVGSFFLTTGASLLTLRGKRARFMLAPIIGAGVRTLRELADKFISKEHKALRTIMGLSLSGYEEWYPQMGAYDVGYQISGYEQWLPEMGGYEQWLPQMGAWEPAMTQQIQGYEQWTPQMGAWEPAMTQQIQGYEQWTPQMGAFEVGYEPMGDFEVGYQVSGNNPFGEPF